MANLILTMKIVIFVCMVCDITITYYYFHLNKIKNTFDIRDEKGPIGRFLFKKFGLSPWAMLLDICFIFLWLNLIMWISDTFSTSIISKYGFYYIVIGIYGIVLWLNWLQVAKLLRNWENKQYWDLRREINRVSL